MPARVRCARSWYRVLTRGRGSAGRASPCQGEGRGFESRRPLHSEDPLNEGVFVVFRASPPEFEVVLLLSAAGVHGEHSTIGISCVAVRAIALTVRYLVGGCGQNGCSCSPISSSASESWNVFARHAVLHAAPFGGSRRPPAMWGVPCAGGNSSTLWRVTRIGTAPGIGNWKRSGLLAQVCRHH
jgi:hypothetical protein